VVPGRSYDDPCGVARALDLVGERWALLIVRDLVLGPKRFTDLSASLPGLSQNVLSQRLRGLERDGLVRRRKLGPPAGSWVYELTPRGDELAPVVGALARFGSRAPITSTRELTADALMLALQTAFEPAAVDGVEAGVEVRLGADHYRAEIADGELRVRRGDMERPGAVLETDVATLTGLVFGGRGLDEALRGGRLTLHGDRGVLERLLGAFATPRPEPMGASAG
jgi:DNA-binding HxlR family transcriptional regulator